MRLSRTTRKRLLTVLSLIASKQSSFKTVNMRKATRNRILSKFGNKCCKCESTEKLEVDHIIPVSKGGTDFEHNLQVLCRSCNAKKGNKIDYENYFKKGNDNTIFVKRSFKELLKNISPTELKAIINHYFNI